jgi:arginyl-tRNA synthetase
MSTTLTLEALEALLASLGVSTPVPRFDGRDVLVNPLDLFRSYLAATLTELVGCEPAVALAAIQLPQAMMGDLEVIVPRLKVKGPKPVDLAFDLCQKVSEWFVGVLEFVLEFRCPLPAHLWRAYPWPLLFYICG